MPVPEIIADRITLEMAKAMPVLAKQVTAW
jgi:hypothetical protein